MLNREYWKKMLPIIQAFVDGKKITHKNVEINFLKLEIGIKPEELSIIEPTNKWLKTGWVESISNDPQRVYQITGICFGGLFLTYFMGASEVTEAELEKHYVSCECPFENKN